jgi:hypothetical protein
MQQNALWVCLNWPMQVERNSKCKMIFFRKTFLENVGWLVGRSLGWVRKRSLRRKTFDEVKLPRRQI